VPLGRTVDVASDVIMAIPPSSDERRLHLRPTSTLGRVSFALMLLCLASSAVIAVLVGAAGLRGRTLGVITLVSAFGTGIAAFGTGLVAVIRKRERSVGVLFAVGIGTLFFLFLLGKFAFSY
jgi:hypothetical protein